MTPPPSTPNADSYLMRFDPGTIKHLGLQMYSTLPPVISELVANAWDAGAGIVRIEVPTGRVTNESTIVVLDDGDGMADTDIERAYLVVGRDRRRDEHSASRSKPPFRQVMGRKGIGKFAGFGIARVVEIETAQGGHAARFVMDYGDMERAAAAREVRFPKQPPTGEVDQGTRVTLSDIQKFRQKSIDIPNLRRGLARRFAVIGPHFTVIVNDQPVTADERDLQRLLDHAHDGTPYLWTYEDEEIEPGSGWKVSGWIGALARSTSKEDGIQRGVTIMARGKLVQEPFLFGSSVGQQFAFAYIVGELHAEFVDDEEDTVGTTRNSLVWDTDANAAFLNWGTQQLNRIAREWSARRRKDGDAKVDADPQYQEFVAKTAGPEKRRARRVADRLIRETIKKNPTGGDEEIASTISLCMEFLEFDAFWELIEEMNDADLDNAPKLLQLFREWELVEAKEMARVTQGRISTIERLQTLIDRNALEVPELHDFLKQFPWVLDPRWQLVADEVRYSTLLAKHFVEGTEIPESDRRIDFLCIREAGTFSVVEIKRPQSVASVKALQQIEDYVHFMRNVLASTTDPEFRMPRVVGYLLCGKLASGYQAEQKALTLRNDGIYVRTYEELLQMVKRSHHEFLDRYEALRKAKLGAADKDS